jgi:preprotein translocase subunit SecG
MNDRPPIGSGNTEAVATARAVTPPQGSPTERDDMIDTLEDSERWPFLKPLGGCHDELVKTYTDADGASKAAQNAHRNWVVVAAIFATLAVVLAIIHLAELLPPPYVAVSELLAVLLAALAFNRGDKTREEWLQERHKAERCRFLKFSSMILPDLYTQGGQLPDEYTSHVGPQMAVVKHIAYINLEKWLSDDTPPPPPGRFLARNLDELTQLRDYYREKRLDFQADYFERQAKRNVKTDNWWRSILPQFFRWSVYFVVVAVALLLLILWAKPKGHTLYLFESGAVICAALLPVFGSGIRIWRSAREATRNISRFRAKYIALQNISQRLRGDRIKNDEEAEGVLRDLWCAEQIMESEHREWLRLMTEAEWAG